MKRAKRTPPQEMRQDETLYRKIGAKFVPVSQYISTDGFPEGSHLVVVKPGTRSTYFRIEPAYADLVAASKLALDAMTRAITKAGELRPHPTRASPREMKAFKAYLDALPKDSSHRNFIGRFLSAHDIAEAGIAALMDAAEGQENPRNPPRYSRGPL